MSSERVPGDVDKILLTLYYKDGFCTIQAIWDDAEISRLRKKGRCVKLFHRGRFDVFVRKSKNSSEITRSLSNEIAERWLNGNYVKVQSALLPGIEDVDWMS